VPCFTNAEKEAVSYHDPREGLFPLPEGWVEAKSPAGTAYYIHLPSGRVSGADPRSLAPTGPLPEGWEECTSREGDVYFVDHATVLDTPVARASHI